MRLELDYLRMLVTGLVLVGGLNWLADATGIRWLNQRSDDLDTYSMLPVYRQFSERPEVVFIGASHTWSGIVPLSIEAQLRETLGREVEVWNLSVPAGVFTQIPALTDLVFSGGRSPRVLCVELGPVYWRDAEDWAEQSENVRAALEGPRPGPDANWRERVRVWVEAHFYGPTALWRQAETLVSEAAGLRAAMARTHGGQWTRRLVARDEAEPGPFMPGLLKRELQAPRAARPRASSVQPSARASEILRGLLQACREHECRLIFWNAPTTRAYQKIFPEGTEGQHLEWVRQQVANSRALVLNLNVPENQRREMFRDIDHLDPSGAEEVGRQLVPYLAERLGP